MTDYINCVENINKAKHFEQRIVKVPLDACIAHSAGMVKLGQASEYVIEICRGCTRWHEPAKALGRWPLKGERKRLTLEPIPKEEAGRRRLSL